MTVEALMTETVTVQRPTGEFTQSASGDPTPVFEDLGSTTMYLEPLNIRTTVGEAREIGYVPLGDWLGIGLAAFGWNSHDRITWAGMVFDIVSPPRVMPNPRLDTMSHTEMDLQLIGEFEVEEEIALCGFNQGFSDGFCFDPIDAFAMPATVGGMGST